MALSAVSTADRQNVIPRMESHDAQAMVSLRFSTATGCDLHENSIHHRRHSMHPSQVWQERRHFTFCCHMSQETVQWRYHVIAIVNEISDST